MVEPRICDKCGRIFQSKFGSNTCPQCENTFEDDYHRVREYLYEFPGATENQIRQMFPSVSHKDVMTWLRTGRIGIADGSKVKLTCEKCGKVILDGYLCAECKKIQERIDARTNPKKEHHSIQKGVAVTRPSDEEESRMRFLNKKNNSDKGNR